MFKVLICREFDQRALGDILNLEQACYPQSWQYPNANEYYADMLGRENSIHIFLRENEVTTGYLLARPLSELYADLCEYDPALCEDPTGYYMETIGVHPEFIGRGGGACLMDALTDEAINRFGCRLLSAHARTKTGLNEMIKRKYPDRLLEVRHIAQWHFGGNEPYEYIVWGI